jgi:hypothetical protein
MPDIISHTITPAIAMPMKLPRSSGSAMSLINPDANVIVEAAPAA